MNTFLAHARRRTDVAFASTPMPFAFAMFASTTSARADCLAVRNYDRRQACFAEGRRCWPLGRRLCWH